MIIFPLLNNNILKIHSLLVLDHEERLHMTPCKIVITTEMIIHKHFNINLNFPLH